MSHREEFPYRNTKTQTHTVIHINVSSHFECRSFNNETKKKNYIGLHRKLEQKIKEEKLNNTLFNFCKRVLLQRTLINIHITCIQFQISTYTQTQLGKGKAIQTHTLTPTTTINMLMYSTYTQNNNTSPYQYSLFISSIFFFFLNIECFVTL